MTNLFLSPHFDDAVLSCGGTIHQLVAAGEKVEVRTVMAGIPSRLPDSALVQELHARWQGGTNPVQVRILEDDAAMQQIGAKTSRMPNWFDCIYRMSRTGEVLYPDEASIFGEINANDRTAQLLPTIVLSPQEIPRVIYVPLGAGHHVDHQIVCNWGITLKQYYPWVALKFYEEYPYTQDPQAVEKALSILKQLYPALRLNLELVSLTEADIQSKLDAIRCYKSQISSFWTDLQQMEAETRQSLRTAANGTGAERYWVVA
ncbi:MAG: PIG-L family deacetylase [Anaerolineae bacterium]|nr:PIG-L family deacetylase [Anaerolineae bacterium]